MTIPVLGFNPIKGQLLTQMLSSRIDALQMPDYGWHIDADRSTGEIVADILARLRSERLSEMMVADFLGAAGIDTLGDRG